MFSRLHKHRHFGHGSRASSSHHPERSQKHSRSPHDQGISPRSAPSTAASQSRATTSGSEPPLYIENQFRRKFPPAGNSLCNSRRGDSDGQAINSTSRRVGSIDNNLMSSTVERGRSRRERTFVGSECTVCEEPLEHTLQGERILQFACSHASHEACFYELIREFDTQVCPTCDAPLHFDTGRGGNVLDIKKLSTMVRSANAEAGPVTPGRLTWDNLPARSASVDTVSRKTTTPSFSHGRASQRSHDVPSERYEPSPRMGPVDSERATPVASHRQENTPTVHQWRHELEAPAVEPPSNHRTVLRNPIPDPVVSIRSEFPSLNKSRLQQTFTCLVTVEVPDNKWIPDPEDIGLPPHPQPVVGGNASVDGRRPTTSPAPQSTPRRIPDESAELLEEMKESLRNRVDNWHGLDFTRFGQLRLFSTLRVGKDKSSWQELECYLFAEMLICVKEKKITAQWHGNGRPQKTTRCTLKGSILVKKHLNEVTETGSVEQPILTLNLSVVELPQFHLKFENRNQLKLWHQALLDLHSSTPPSPKKVLDTGADLPHTDEENDWQRSRHLKPSSISSSWGNKSTTTHQTENNNGLVAAKSPRPSEPMHVPIDVVVVVPISASMQGVKINLVRDALKFIVNTLGERDRLGIVAFGSGGGGVPVVGLTTKAWAGWPNVLNAIKPVGQKTHRADVVEGANVAMDLLMQRKQNNPIASIMLISDSSTSDPDSVDFVVSRAEAAKISIYSFGLGMTHKPDTMIELSTRTKACYTYVKDWMMLRECLAGCVGALQTLSHLNVKLKLKLPEGSPAKFHKISGALQITKRASGRDAEASLGDLRFGDKRDILIQFLVQPDHHSSSEPPPQDPWDNIVEGLEDLGAVDETEKNAAIEEVPIIQADLAWGDILRGGTVAQMPRPSLMAISMLPVGFNQRGRWQSSPPIPPHPSIVQRRMELLTSDMLTRALTLVSRGQHDRAHTLLNETRSILKGLGKGGLPPVPPIKSTPSTPRMTVEAGSPLMGTSPQKRSPSPPTSTVSVSGSFSGSQIGASRNAAAAGMTLGIGIDATTVAALDAELETSLEWINHPAVFGRDSRKAVLQAIGVISSQRAFTYRSPIESLWAERVGGIKRLADRSREWREEGGGEGGIAEES